MFRHRPLTRLTLGGVLVALSMMVTITAMVTPLRSVTSAYRAARQSSERRVVSRGRVESIRASSDQALLSIGLGLVTGVLGMGLLVSWVMGSRESTSSLAAQSLKPDGRPSPLRVEGREKEHGYRLPSRNVGR